MARRAEGYITSANSDYLFVPTSSEKLSTNDIWRIVRNAAEKAGIQKVIAVKISGDKIYKVKPHVLPTPSQPTRRSTGFPTGTSSGSWDTAD